MVSSFSSLLVKSTTPWESRLLCYCMDNSKACEESLSTLDTWAVWSLTELMMGKYMEYGPWAEPVSSRNGRGGQDIAGGFSGILVAHRGDEKYMLKAYHVSVSWLSKQCCWSCRASRLSTSDNLYTHFGANAHHRMTLVDTSEFILACNANAWVRLPGWHCEVLTYDFLHVFDLSLVPDAAASAPYLNLCTQWHICAHVLCVCKCAFVCA